MKQILYGVAYYDEYMPYDRLDKDVEMNEISPRPILFVVGDRAHSRFFSDAAYESALEPKEMLVVEDGEHIDLYDRGD